MIVYEVNLAVDVALRGAYLPWLKAHVTEMLSFDGFASATIETVIDPAPPAGRFALCVRYRVRDQACLDDYFARHAARMREDGLARFGNGFSASRRVLEPMGLD